MTFRDLEIFVEVCRHMNMSKAAQALMISQSSVSQAIASLEKEYQILLFERLNRTLYLTEAGEQMRYLAFQVLKSVAQLDEKMKNHVLTPTLDIGACSTIGACLLYPLIAEYRKQYGNTLIRAKIHNSKFLEERLQNGQLDLAIVQETTPVPCLSYLPFLEDTLILICSNEHPLAGKEVFLEELQKETFISREEGSATDLLLRGAFASQGLPLKIDWICNNIDSVKQAVTHQMGIALISKFLAGSALRAHTFSQIKVRDFQFSRRFVLAFHKDKVGMPEFWHFLDLCRNLGQNGLEKLIDG